MTREDIETIRQQAAIEGELRIIESIPFHHFSSVCEPDLLGKKIVAECVERIRWQLDKGASNGN